jgi:5-methylcytosine-specific restriction enzyme subunit McrC
MATAYVMQAERALRVAVLQGYRRVEEALPMVKGRIRTSDQLRRRFGMLMPVEVAYDEFDIDIPENQILKAGADRLLSLPGLPPAVRARVAHVLRMLADVTLPRRGMPMPRWQPSSLNANYHLALRLAELIVRWTSIEQRVGDVRATGLMLNMSTLFEQFLTAALCNALTAYGGVTRGQDRTTLDEAGLIVVKPDLVWYPDGTHSEPGAVFDAKYKAEKPAGYPHADLYQMLAYCTVLGLDRGHLIYAKGQEVPGERTIRHAGITVVQQALDLDVEPEALLAQIDQVAAAAVGQSARL